MRVHVLLAGLLLGAAIGVAADLPLELPVRAIWTGTGNAFKEPGRGDAEKVDEAALPIDSAGATTGAPVTGTLTSPAFRLTQPWLTFALAGGAHPFRTALHLWSEGRIVRTSTGSGTEAATWRSWDVRPWLGHEVSLQLVDLVGAPGGFIRLDALAMSKGARGAIEGDVDLAVAAVRREMKADVTAAQPRARGDPQRPIYHFHPPAQRMNDPNAPFFQDGWYHLFYQWNVFADRTGDGLMFWGHARSRDLVQWQHLPLALVPQWDRGEVQCYSGDAFAAPGKRPELYYTFVPATVTPRSQWRAVAADPEWRTWRRQPAAPLLDLATQDGPPMNTYWRDPFLFECDGRVFMLLAAEQVPIYEATDTSLTHWTYRGVFYDRPGLSAECPNLYRFGDRWLLLISPKGPVEWITGRFDARTAKFTPERSGRLHQTAQLYATQGLADARGRQILFGLIKGFPNGAGWRDCLALPRVLTLAADGTPRMEPVSELQALRRSPQELRNLVVANGRRVLPAVRGDALELIVTLKRGTARAFGLTVRCSDDGRRGIALRYAEGALNVPGRGAAPIPLPLVHDTLTLHVFLDKGAIEVFAGEGRVAEVRPARPPAGDVAVEVFAEDGDATVTSVYAWQMAPAVQDDFPWPD